MHEMQLRGNVRILATAGLVLVAWSILCTGGCGTHQDITLKTPPASSYVLSLDSVPANAKPAKVVLGRSTVDGKVLTGSVRNQEYDQAVTDLVALLNESKLFKSVDKGTDAKAVAGTVLVELCFEDQEHLRAGEAGANGFMVGFFTLGTAPVTFPYTFDSRMTLTVTDGATRKLEYSNSVNANGVHYIGEPLTERPLGRRLLTQDGLKSLVSQLVTDAKSHSPGH